MPAMRSTSACCIAASLVAVYGAERDAARIFHAALSPRLAGCIARSMTGATGDASVEAWVVQSPLARIAGLARAARIAVRGAGAIDARELLVKDAEVAANGPGDIALAASGTAEVASSGAGSIVVMGNAACAVKATGSGEVVCGR